jgi:hypothetical protein
MPPFFFIISNSLRQNNAAIAKFKNILNFVSSYSKFLAYLL